MSSPRDFGDQGFDHGHVRADAAQAARRTRKARTPVPSMQSVRALGQSARWPAGQRLERTLYLLLPRMDGTRDRDALADELMSLLRKDVITFTHGVRLWGEVELREAALEWIDATPQRLVHMKLA